MTTSEFIEKANKKFIHLSDILVLSYKIAYRDTCELECRLILANMYLNILKSLGENYALSNDEIKSIILHLIILLELRDIKIPNIDDFKLGIVTNSVIEIIYVPIMPNNIKVIKYNTDGSIGGLTYSVDNEGNTVIGFTHNMNKTYPIISLVEDTGNVIEAGIKHVTPNYTEITFVSNSEGTAIFN